MSRQILLLLMVGVAACNAESTLPGAEAPRDYRNGVASRDSVSLRPRTVASLLPEFPDDAGACYVQWNVVGTTNCSTIAVSESPSTPRLEHRGHPSFYHDSVYTVEFPDTLPVYNVRVVGTGAMKCDAYLGGVVAYDTTDVEIGEWEGELIEPEDCGEDDVTFGASTRTIRGTLISRIEIVPPDPMAFDVVVEGITYQGYVTQRYTIYFTTTAGTQALVVACTSQVERGGAATCTAQLALPKAFTVIRRTASGGAFSSIIDSVPENVSSGASASWSGTMAATSLVGFQVTVAAPGGLDTLIGTAPDSIVVTMPSAMMNDYWQLGSSSAVIDLGVGVIPTSSARLDQPGDRLAIFELQTPSDLSLPIGRGTGPNAGLGFLTAPFMISEGMVIVHPALDLASLPTVHPWRADATAWVNDQDASSPGQCLASAIPTLLTNVRRHEGVGYQVPSHPRVADSVFSNEYDSPQQAIRAIVFPGSDSAIRGKADSIYRRFITTGPYLAAQSLFDSLDIPVVMSAVGCTFDFVP